ncbi:uncharacterized protein LOC128958699 [Oppia nitens]|uniref:uncharacterized protein LOC128958699 n=1 Tax=Oppia nitens TaxID=1686743 RepID=UPI0023DB658C|nr:uncharacterized protein LOC128958699 [Oppia nitens]
MSVPSTDTTLPVTDNIVRNTKYDRDFYFLGKSVLRLGICIFIVTIVAKFAFGDNVSPILITVLCVIGVLLIILGIIRITCSYRSVRRHQLSNGRSRDEPVHVSTISNFRAFIRDNSRQNDRPVVQLEDRPPLYSNNHLNYGTTSVMSILPNYDPPPSYEQSQYNTRQS